MQATVFKIMKIYILLLNIICFCNSNTSAQSSENKNKITVSFWNVNRVYNYQITYTDSNQKVITKEELLIEPTGEIWEADTKQTLVNFTAHFKSEDSIKLAPYPINGKLKPWSRKWQEGVIQNENKIWMHPIRQNQYQLTEIAPFPEVKFPLQLQMQWNNTLWIYKVFGSFEGTVESNYEVTAFEERDYSFGKRRCWKINASGKHDKLGENNVTYYFDVHYGFTEMHYRFFNGYNISIILQSMKEE